MTSRITLKDIASYSGFSRSTVSLVMQNDPVVAEDTRVAIQKAADDLGYVYNRAAASLRSKQSGIFGLVVSDLSNPFFAEMILGIEKTFESEERVVLLGQHSENLASQERMLRKMLEARVDGILLVATRSTEISTFDQIKKWGIPTVLLTRKIPKANASYVGPNNIDIAEQATDHLFEHKRKTIAFIGGQIGSQVHNERLQGVLNSAKKHGIDPKDVIVIGIDSSRTAGYKSAQQLLTISNKNIGILTYNDIVAFGVMAALRDAGVAIGKDVSVIGIDDVVGAKYESPALTSVHLESEKIGQRGAELMLQLSKGESVKEEEIIIEGSLVIRESCGCVGEKGRST